MESKKVQRNLGVELKKKIIHRDNYRCLRCGSKNNLTIDHIIPVSRKGDKSNNNLQTLCEKCNTWKGDTIVDFRGEVPLVSFPLNKFPVTRLTDEKLIEFILNELL